MKYKASFSSRQASLRDVSFPPNWMDREAEKIVRYLQKDGFRAYLVGGCVRDTLAGFKSKDFDIVTNARPGQIRRRISSSYVIGRRFRLVLVKKGEKQFEVSTFRRRLTLEEEKEIASRPSSHGSAPTSATSDSTSSISQKGKKQKRSNSYTNPLSIFHHSPEEDAQRRDFTLNALYYDPIQKELLDYCGGYKDIEEGYVRMIGEPLQRLSEDPIRILRALRLAHKLNFTLEEELRRHLSLCAHLLKEIPLARKREEYLKILRLSDPLSCFYEAYDLGLFAHTLPYLQKLFGKDQQLESFHGYMERFGVQQWDGLGGRTSGVTGVKRVADAVEVTGVAEVVGREVGLVGTGYPPLMLLAPFLLALVRTCVEPDPKKELKLFEETSFLEFVFKEMGIHRNEAFPLFKALEMQQALNDLSDFKRKGSRYKGAFVRHRYFPLALWLASLDQSLSAEELLFWQAQFILRNKPL